MVYQWSGNGLETVVLINGSVFNYHQWDRQAEVVEFDGVTHMGPMLLKIDGRKVF